MRAAQQRLARHATAMQAITAEQRLLFDQRRFQAELRRDAGDNETTGAAANDHNVALSQYLFHDYASGTQLIDMHR